MWWLSAPTRHKVWCPRLSIKATWEDPSLCYGPAILGWKSPTTLGQPTTPAGGMCKGITGTYDAIDHIHRWGSSWQGSSITLIDCSPFPMLWGSGRRSSGSPKGLKPQEKLESPFSGFLFNHPLPGMLQAPPCPFNSDSLNPNCSQPVNLYTRYFHPVDENTPGQPCDAKVGATAGIHRDGQVLAGRQCTPHNYWPPTGADNFTRPFSRDYHGYNDVYMGTAGCCNGHHLCRYHDGIYEPSKLGIHPYGGGPPHSHPEGCHKVGVRRLSVDAAISTWCHQHWCHISPAMAVVPPFL